MSIGIKLTWNQWAPHQEWKVIMPSKQVSNYKFLRGNTQIKMLHLMETLFLWIKNSNSEKLSKATYCILVLIAICSGLNSN